MSVNEVKLKRALEEFKVLGKGDAGSRTFSIGNEDHTLGNSLRHILINMGDKVEFAGYSVPHPSEPSMNLRIQTLKRGLDQRIPAVGVLKEACRCLSDICDFMLLDHIETLLPLVKDDRLKMEQFHAQIESDNMGETEDMNVDDSEGETEYPVDIEHDVDDYNEEY